ncbi:hypothetical protein [Cryobacterium sp. SO1]|uniref:hypothetical protein n=1 Tax=Cryobacterium sp. SO1 TaxID=1897061 RepID=UPI00210D0812|nr:hypothetical protein [Cryobacterium sp. SO1]
MRTCGPGAPGADVRFGNSSELAAAVSGHGRGRIREDGQAVAAQAAVSRELRGRTREDGQAVAAQAAGAAASARVVE